jgi:hypothetical protein
MRGRKEPDKTKIPQKPNIGITSQNMLSKVRDQPINKRKKPHVDPKPSKVAQKAKVRVNRAAMRSRIKTKMKATLMLRRNQARRRTVE